jgi:hypothetical protein
MDDEEIALTNACTDLVSLKSSEAFPVRLLGEIKPGEWVRVGDLCRQLGLAQANWQTELFATWLPDPAGNDGYAVIVFYDDDSKWSMCAQYNRSRLLNRAAPSRVPLSDSVPAAPPTSAEV